MNRELEATGLYAKERKARPLETFCALLWQDRRAFDDIMGHLLHGSATVRVALDPQGCLAEKCYQQIEEINQRLDSRAEALANERREFVRSERKKDKWASPSAAHVGWLCPESPTGICSYEYRGGYSEDTCDHCGFPEERK